MITTCLILVAGSSGAADAGVSPGREPGSRSASVASAITPSSARTDAIGMARRRRGRPCTRSDGVTDRSAYETRRFRAQACTPCRALRPGDGGGSLEDGQERQAGREPYSAPDHRGLGPERELEEGVERARRERQLRAPLPLSLAAQDQSDEGGGREEERVEVRVAHVTPAGGCRGAEQRAPDVATVVAVHDVVVRPQRRVGGHRYEQPPTRAGHAVELRERGAVVGRVLD